MKLRYSIMGVLAVLVFSAAGAADNDSARDRLNRFSDGVHALSCDFTQQVTDARGDLQPAIQGSLALAVPRQFRWRTDSPQEQLIVADGARVWIYDPALEQVSVRRQSEAEANSPLTILTDLSRLDEDYTVSEQGAHDGLVWLQLLPKEEGSAFESAKIGFDGDVLRQMVFSNNLGGQSMLTFRNWQRNPELPPDTFEFTPPEGVDVVGDAGSTPQTRGIDG